MDQHDFYTGYRPRNTRQWITCRTNRANRNGDNTKGSNTKGSNTKGSNTKGSKGKGSKGTEGRPEHHNTGIQHHLHIRIYREDSVNGDDFDARSPFSDVARLGRWLMGTQTGLTLGGGGARYIYNTAVACCGCAVVAGCACCHCLRLFALVCVCLRLFATVCHHCCFQSTLHTLIHILSLSTTTLHHHHPPTHHPLTTL